MCHIILIPGILKLENLYLETVTNAQFTLHRRLKWENQIYKGCTTYLNKAVFKPIGEVKNNFKSDKKRLSKHN